MIVLIVPSDLQSYFLNNMVKRDLELRNYHQLALSCIRLPDRRNKTKEVLTSSWNPVRHKCHGFGFSALWVEFLVYIPCLCCRLSF